MAYWLIKTDPQTWSWQDQVKAGATAWDGVSNAQALGYLRQMKVGDRCFFYLSGDDRCIVGIVRVTKAFYPDPKDPAGKLGVIDVKTDRALKNPVTLAAIKADKTLAHLALVRQSRLSVMPVDEPAWEAIVGKSQAPVL